MTPETIVKAACRAADEISEAPSRMNWDGWEPALYLPDRADKIAALLPVVADRGARIEGIIAVADVIEATRDWIRSRRISISHDHRLLPEQLRAHRALRRLRREKGDLRRLFIHVHALGDYLDELVDEARHCPGPLPGPQASVDAWTAYLRDHASRIWPVLFGGSLDECVAEEGRRYRSRARHEAEEMAADVIWDWDADEYLDTDLEVPKLSRFRFDPARPKDPRDWPKLALPRFRTDARLMRAPEEAAEAVVREIGERNPLDFQTAGG